MKTSTELSYNEMKTFIKENNIEVPNMKKDTLLEAIEAFNTPAEPVVKVVETRGRKIDPNSARQKRLALVGKVKRGRPVDPNSAWNIKQTELEEKREAGELKQGRPIDPTSARQIKLAEMEARRAAGTLKRGRPAKVESEVVVAEEETIGEVVEIPTEVEVEVEA